MGKAFLQGYNERASVFLLRAMGSGGRNVEFNAGFFPLTQLRPWFLSSENVDNWTFPSLLSWAIYSETTGREGFQHVCLCRQLQPGPQSPRATRLGGRGSRLQVVTGTDSSSGSHAGLWICWKKRDGVMHKMSEKNPSPLASDFLFASSCCCFFKRG